MVHGDTKARRPFFFRRACINYSASLCLCVLNLKPRRIFRLKNKKVLISFGCLRREGREKNYGRQRNYIMTAIELNAQLLREISNIADNESYLQKTLDFITKLTKSKSSTTVRGQAYLTMLERLSDYQEYKKGWDGDDALPISTLVVKNFKKVLQKSTDSDLDGWTIYPAANGTLLLQHKERKSGINIGTQGFSYYATQNGEVKGENHLKFSPKAILETMKRI